MCRPSCCPPSNEGTGIAAVAVLAGGAVAYEKIGPAVARIWHLAIETVEIFTLSAATAAVAIVASCMTARIIRTRRARQQLLLQTVAADTDSIDGADAGPECLACGDTGTVLRAITASSYQQAPCPQCQPTHRAG